ncbi:MAG TPA: hypothetical protein VMV69_00140 [Pirellulales bacterium]|nr:hypothetical protein [Pirellulales bacterium]
MSETVVTPRIVLRIPGDWSHPKELVERLPKGLRLSPEALLLSDGTEIEFTPMPADGEFPRIFQSACRRPATDDELAVLARYRVNVGLSGAGGSLEAALAMMQAGAAIVRAGGAGVFIDNSALAHGGNDWIAMTEDGGPEAISFAFASIIRGSQKVSTMGMQTMGFPDLRMRSSDVDERGETIVEIIRYICGGTRAIHVGHVLADERGPRFQVVAKESDEFDAESSMHNPYGRLKIVSVKEIADNN